MTRDNPTNTQPEHVSELLLNYLGMTAASRDRRAVEEPARPLSRRDREREIKFRLDNDGLSLEEGNDFA